MRSIAVVLLALFASIAGAEGALHVEKAWSRAMPPVAENGVVYLTLRNHGQEADRLLSADTIVSSSVSLHETVDEGGVMKMRAVDGIDVPAGGEVMLAPGGLHLMLMGLKQPLVEGASLALTLRFENAGDMAVEVPIMAAGASSGGMSHSHGHSKAKKE